MHEQEINNNIVVTDIYFDDWFITSGMPCLYLSI